MIGGETMAQEFKSLAEMRPDIATEWHPTKNGDLTPEKVASKSSKRVWWLCPKGHEYEQRVANRTTRSLSCPYCSRHKLLNGFNDLETMFPEIAKEWNPTKNGGLTPNSIAARSSNKVWWICSKGHEWQATVASRTDADAGRGCPYCSNRKLLRGFNDLATKFPDVAKEWDYEKNGDLSPSDVIAGTPKRVWWKCSNCGHEYYSQIASRTTMSSSCPNCAKRQRSSFPEQAILFYLSKIYTDVINSFHVEWLGKQEIDIYIPSLKTGVEYDGIHWHNSKAALSKGKKKYELCRTHDVRLIRVSEFDYPKDGYCDSIIVRDNPQLDVSLEKCIVHLFAELGDVSPEINLQRDNIAIVSQYYSSLRSNSLQAVFPLIAEEWDYENNHGVTPEMVSAFSNERFYWRCRNSHSFKKAVYERTRTDGKATGCPYCSNKRVLTGYNDLLTTHPEIKTEWDYTKNQDLNPSMVVFGTPKKVWWICPKGHSYYQSVEKHVLMHQGCPICAGKIVMTGDNDLATAYPKLLKEWDYEKNNGISPQLVYAGGRKKVWWFCPKGHSYKATIYSRAKRGCGCPYCSNRMALSGFNDLETNYPNVAKEWDLEKNNNLSPNEVLFGSHKYAWWRCSVCGESWKALIVNRTKNHAGCPRCGRENAAKKLQKK